MLIHATRARESTTTAMLRMSGIAAICALANACAVGGNMGGPDDGCPRGGCAADANDVRDVAMDVGCDGPTCGAMDVRGVDAIPTDGTAPDVSCATGSSLCAGRCADLQRDATNCGMCGITCAMGEACTAGVCARTCLMGQTACGAACVDLLRHPMHCGRCFNPCMSGQVCIDGRCTFDCPAGQTACAMGCVNTNIDVNNCGRCGNICLAVANGTPICGSGVCGFTCMSGFADCNRTPSDGCEASLSTMTNCGSCGRACGPFANATATCVLGGTCLMMCLAGYGDCNRVQADGCETQVVRSPNCGSCGVSCTGTANPNCCPGLVGVTYSCSTRFIMCNP